MDNIQSQMNSILENPEMMQKIMEMAQSLGQGQPVDAPSQIQESSDFQMPEIDFATIQKISSFIGKSNIDKEQRTLLNALSPFLSHQRIAKLEKAMRASKLATVASSVLSSSGFQFNLGR